MAHEATKTEQELAKYLQERIKPNLNSGAIPLLARSIARELAERGVAGNGNGNADAGDAQPAESGDEPKTEESQLPDFETEMHDLQDELGKDWIVRFSVHGDEEWLTAEKEDGSQHVEAETADVLIEAVGLLKDRGRDS